MAHPRKYSSAHPLVERLRGLCLALPAVFEKEAWGECTFRVERGSMFAMTDCDHHGSGHTAVWVKAPPLAQGELVERNAKVYFVPPYMGHKGWVGVRLDGKVNWKELQRLLVDAHFLSAPAKLRASLEPGGTAKEKSPSPAARKTKKTGL